MGSRILVGRSRELEELGSGLEEAVAGRGGLFLLAGEPGVGKTTLADRFAREAETRGVRVVWGRAWEAGGAPAFWPWRQVLRALRLELPAGEDRRGEAEDDAGQERLARFERVVSLLADACAARPSLVVLDDLHAADHSSLLLLELVATAARTMPLLLLGTYREHEARLGPEAGALLARIARGATRLPLRRLDLREVAALARAEGAELHGAALAELYRVSEGNPLFVREVLRLLPADTADTADAAAVARPLPVPEGVREVIAARLSRLPGGARGVLEVAAVAGREFGPEVVGAVLGLGAEEVDRRLGPAAQAEVVVQLGEQRWAFTHVLLRDALERGLSPARRAGLHAAVADVLERAGPGASPAELAHHRLQAVPAIPATAAVAAAVRAADGAMAELAFEDAAGLLERALALAPAADRGDLLVGLAQARLRAGDAAGGKRAAREAAGLAAAAGDGVRLAHAALAHGAEFTPALIDRELVGLLEDALARLPAGDGALRARVMARLAAARQPAPDPEPPTALAREAIAMARRAGGEGDLREVLHAAISAVAHVAPPRERAELGEELLRLCDAAGDRVRTLRTHARLVFDHAEAGALAPARAHLDAYEALAAGFRAGRYRWPALAMRAMWALFEGREDDFERFQGEAGAAGDPAADPNLRMVLATQQVERRLLGRPEALEDVEEQIRSAAATAALRALSIPAYLARVAVRRGELERARAALAAIPPELLGVSPFHAIMLVEPVAAVGDVHRAAFLYERLLPLSSWIPSLGMTGMVLGPPMTRYLGLLAGALGRAEEAGAHLADAIARLEVLGGRAWLERVREEAAALGGAASRPAPAPPGPPAAIALEREGEYFAVRVGGGRATRLRDSKGLRMLAHLLAHPGEEFHALTLTAPGEDALLGDAGEVLDRQAAREYRDRLEDAREALLEAERLGDPGRAERAREELDWLAGELTRGVGLGGRQRRAASAAERARVNVQRRIRQAIQRIAEGQPELGRFLGWAVRTGTYCSYQPEGTPFRAKSRRSS